MEVPCKSIHKVTLMLPQHPHQGLQLGQSEDLLGGASRLEGSSGPLQHLHTLRGGTGL